MRKLFILILLTLPLAARGPGNDHFKDAIAIGPSLPLKQEGTLLGSTRTSPATREPGEFNHAGQKTGGSVWYTYTPVKNMKIGIQVHSDKFDPIIAAYTGGSITQLRLVHRYEKFAFPAFSRASGEPFTAGARIEFQAKAGQTYHLAVDTENDRFGPFTISMRSYRDGFNPELELVKAGAIWDYLLATDDKSNPVDPKSLDPDFFKTWKSFEGYQGPRFSKGRAPLGYGELDSFKTVKTNPNGRLNSIPPDGLRYTAYFRKSITPELDVSAIGIEGIVDDGAIIYLNGVEICRINMASDQKGDDWKALAVNSKRGNNVPTEDILHNIIVRDVNLPANIPATLAISIHNAKGNSSDLGMDLRIYSIE